jgi:hypothetical protein
MDQLTLKRLFANHGVPQVDFIAVEGPDCETNASTSARRSSSTRSTPCPASPTPAVYAKLFDAGVAYPELCDRLVKLAAERHRRERAYEF